MGQQKVAIVIAGGSGMGAAAARHLHQAGYAVGILSSSGKGEALAKELGGVGVTGSNQNVADMQKLVDAVMQRFGRIDVLVNGAGHGPKGDLLAISDEDWIKGLEVYFLNVVRATRLVAPLMQKQGGGSIINISSAWAFEPAALFPTSAVARSGLAAYTKLFCDQFGKDNIRMNNVLPGWIDSLPKKDERQAAVPLQRYGKAEEIGATIGFLASPGAAYITGQNIKVDGGLMHHI